MTPHHSASLDRTPTTAIAEAPPRRESKPDAVFVTYNSESHLARQVPSMLREAFGAVISVDNGSADRSVELADRAGFETMRLEGNRGYAVAVNAGVRRSGSDHVMVMNPDVVIDSPARVPDLLVHFDDPRVGLVAPALLLPTGNRQDSARHFPHPWELVWRRLTGAQHGRVDTDAPGLVDWVVGACVCIRRAAFDAVGGFDERYRFYFEDVDFCLRLWAGGWKVVYDPTVLIRHEHGAASRRTLLGWPMRQHICSAARFYRTYPAFASVGRARSGRPHEGSPLPA
jgi:GT2 family glycosyltransferase